MNWWRPIVVLVFAVLVTSSASAFRTEPQADAKGCTHLTAVVAYNGEKGWVSKHLTPLQATIVLSGLGAPEDLQAKIDSVEIAKYVPAKDQVNSPARKRQLVEEFGDVVMVVVSGKGCYFGAFPAPAEVVAALLAGKPA